MTRTPRTKLRYRRSGQSWVWEVSAECTVQQRTRASIEPTNPTTMPASLLAMAAMMVTCSTGRWFYCRPCLQRCPLCKSTLAAAINRSIHQLISIRTFIRACASPLTRTPMFSAACLGRRGVALVAFAVSNGEEMRTDPRWNKIWAYYR